MSKKFLQTSSMLTLIGLSFFSFSARSMDRDRLQQDAEFNQALGRGNPIPQNYPQPALGRGQVQQPNRLQQDAALNQALGRGNPIPQNYPQPIGGRGQVQQPNQLQRNLELNQERGSRPPAKIGNLPLAPNADTIANLSYAELALQFQIARDQISLLLENKAAACKIIKEMKNDNFYNESFPCDADDYDDDVVETLYQLSRTCNRQEVGSWIVNDVRTHKFSSLESLEKLEELLSPTQAHGQVQQSNRLQQDAALNQALGRANPIPQNHPQPTGGRGQVQQPSRLQQDATLNQALGRGHPTPQNYPQTAAGRGLVQQQNRPPVQYAYGGEVYDPDGDQILNPYGGFDVSPYDVQDDLRDYQRGIDINTWQGGDPSPDDEG